MPLPVGSFVLPGVVIARVAVSAPAKGIFKEDLDQRVRAAFIFGGERTLMEDVAFGIQQIADIALKALSPGINDPTTATTCIDRLAELMVACGKHPAPDLEKHVPESGVKLLIASPHLLTYWMLRSAKYDITDGPMS